MSLHADLLSQARHLASKEPRKPRQASLRRAVSAAYYAIFHSLVNEGARVMAPNPVRTYVARAFTHGDMRAVCKQFATANVSPALGPYIQLPLETEIRFVADTFVVLQEVRHRADYDLTASFSRVDALANIGLVEQAFTQWAGVRGKHNATAFLAALLHQKHVRS